MILATGCLGPARLDGLAIRDALQAVGLDEVLLVVGDIEHSAPNPAALDGLKASAVRASLAALDTGLALAARTRSPRLVIELPADLDLPDACRTLHALGRRTPGLALAVATPEQGPLAGLENLRLLFEDLNASGLGYWHVPSRVHRAGVRDATWLDGVGRWLVGASLDDLAGDERGLPPGLGEVDFSAVAANLPRGLPSALDVSPVPDVAMLRMALDVLSTVGLR